MPTGRIELLRRVYEGMNTGDGVSGVIELLHPDFEWVNPDYALEPGIRRGHSGFRAAMSNLDAAFESYRHEPGEVVDLGEKALCFVTFIAQGRDSGVTYRKLEPHVWTFRDGSPVRMQWFHDVDDALGAAGLDRSDPRVSRALESVPRDVG